MHVAVKILMTVVPTLRRFLSCNRISDVSSVLGESRKINADLFELQCEYQIFLYLTINMLSTYPTAILVFGNVHNIRFISFIAMYQLKFD